jgi:sterol desaturase/sphingolipid hydroxylase (fatty acid hydroxylase superfamily)
MWSALVGLVVLGLGFGVIQRLWPALPNRALWRRRGLLTDTIHYFFGMAIHGAIAAVMLAIVVIAIALVAGVPLDPDHLRSFAVRARWFGELPVAVQISIVLVGGDLVAYWIHRAFHRGRLWRFHAVHHSSRDLDWLSGARIHPVNEALQRALQAIPFIALGIDARVVVTAIPVLSLYAISLHANLRWTFGPLRYVLASPTFHRWHHTSEAAGLDKNFAGMFPIWDLVFGTFHMPRGAQPREFGTHDDVPDGFLGQLIWPFTASARRRRSRSRAVA